jgi:DNA-binding response OmpR family regulator
VQTDRSETLGAKGGQRRVLLVEGNTRECSALARALERAGFAVDCAASVGEALAKILTGPRPAAALVEINLPDASGGLVVWRLRRTYCRDVPIAIVTGIADPLSHPDLVRDPPDKLFVKPAEVGPVICWLTEVLRGNGA